MGWVRLVCPGLGPATRRFPGHAGLLEYAGEEEKAAGGGAEGAGGGAARTNPFNSEHQTHSVEPAGPDRSSLQSGAYSSAHRPAPTRRGSDTKTALIELGFCFLPPQMRGMRSSWSQPTPAAMHANPQRSARTVWDSRVEGYIILRDLDLYLTKLARDFLLLASKTRT